MDTNPVTTLDVLRAARALVAKGWTQRAHARDKDGRPINEETYQAHGLIHVEH